MYIERIAMGREPYGDGIIEIFRLFPVDRNGQEAAAGSFRCAFPVSRTGVCWPKCSFASARTCAGNFLGRLNSSIIASISAWGSAGLPRIFIILPVGGFRSVGYN